MNSIRPVIGLTLIVYAEAFIALPFLCGLFGVVFAFTGVVIGLRGASKSTSVSN
jgi:hypothetical protein